jgi:hypothetical protein
MKPIKWIIGYIDWQGAIFAHVVREGDIKQSHGDFWPVKIASHGKWRWDPEKPYSLNTYGEDIDDEDMYRITHRIEKLREVF